MTTRRDYKKNCSRKEQGYWAGVADLAQCAERCRGCANCRYASFSWALNLTLTLTLTRILTLTRTLTLTYSQVCVLLLGA